MISRIIGVNKHFKITTNFFLFEKFTRACLHQIALEIMLLSMLIFIPFNSLSRGLRRKNDYFKIVIKFSPLLYMEIYTCEFILVDYELGLKS